MPPLRSINALGVKLLDVERGGTRGGISGGETGKDEFGRRRSKKVALGRQAGKAMLAGKTKAWSICVDLAAKVAGELRIGVLLRCGR